MESKQHSIPIRWWVWGAGLVVLAAGLWLLPKSSKNVETVLGPDYTEWQQEQPVPTVESSDAAGGVLSLGTGAKPWQDVYIQTGGGKPHLILDYGELVLGTPVLVLDSKSGGNLNLRYTEKMDGKEYEPLTQETGFSLTAGEQTITDSPRLFRYLEISFENHPDATTLKDVQLTDVRQGSRLGYFHSSDEELNKIWRMSARSIELSTAATYIDSPHRDNATWLGDAREIAWADQFLTGDRRVADATLAAFAKRVRPDGAMIAVDHLSADNHEDWVFLDYLSRFVTMVYDHYHYYRDETVLRQYKSLIDQQLDYLKQRTNADGLLVVSDDLAPAYDWSSTKRSGVVAYHQVVYQQALFDGAGIAYALGDRERGDTYIDQGVQVKSQALRQLSDPSSGLLLDFLAQPGVEAPHIPLDANVLAILAGWYQPDQAQAHLKELKRRLETPYGWKAVDEPYSHIDGRFDVSPLMNARVVEALYYNQIDTTPLDLAKTVWGSMQRQGATTAWEFLSPQDGSIAGSVSHGWSGLLARVLPEQLLGLGYDDEEPSHYVLYPKLTLLDSFEVAVPTRFGVLAAVSRKDGDAYVFQISLPKGATAQVLPPEGFVFDRPTDRLRSGTVHTLRLILNSSQ